MTLSKVEDGQHVENNDTFRMWRRLLRTLGNFIISGVFWRTNSEYQYMLKNILTHII